MVNKMRHLPSALALRTAIAPAIVHRTLERALRDIARNADRLRCGSACDRTRRITHYLISTLVANLHRGIGSCIACLREHASNASDATALLEIRERCFTDRERAKIPHAAERETCPGL